MIRRADRGLASAALACALIVGLAAVAPVRADSEATAPMFVVAASTTRDGAVSVQVKRGDDGLEIEGRCHVGATPAQAWNVLTDYDAIDTFVSSMRESRITDRGDGYIMVDQVAVGRLLFFSRQIHATLRVHETPMSTIRFEDVAHRDFEHYQGEWRIEPSGDGVEIHYRLEARPSFSIPDMIARRMFAHTVRDLLEQVVGEIDRRAMLANGSRAPAAIGGHRVESAP